MYGELQFIDPFQWNRRTLSIDIQNSDVVDEIVDRVSDFTNRFFRTEMRDLTKSFSRLAQVTFERTVKWPGNADVIEQVKEILQRATHEMEAVRPRGG